MQEFPRPLMKRLAKVLLGSEFDGDIKKDYCEPYKYVIRITVKR